MATDNCEKIRVCPTGAGPVVFEGREVASVDSRRPCQKESRWYRLTLYRMNGTKWALEVTYCTQWENERSVTGLHWGSPSDITRALMGGACRCLCHSSSMLHQPTDIAQEAMGPIPPDTGDKLNTESRRIAEERYMRVLQGLQNGWAHAVSDLLGKAGPDFETRLE